MLQQLPAAVPRQPPATPSPLAWPSCERCEGAAGWRPRRGRARHPDADQRGLRPPPAPPQHQQRPPRHPMPHPPAPLLARPRRSEGARERWAPPVARPRSNAAASATQLRNAHQSATNHRTTPIQTALHARQPRCATAAACSGPRRRAAGVAAPNATALATRPLHAAATCRLTKYRTYQPRAPQAAPQQLFQCAIGGPTAGAAAAPASPGAAPPPRPRRPPPWRP